MSQTLAMVEEYGNNPRDVLEEIFSNLDIEVYNIYCNMTILNGSYG
jgi:hypothetical protein